jgi:pilus assembly protein Flp/PilA
MLKKKFHKLVSPNRWKNEEGATAVEYGLLVGLIAVFLITAMSQLGDSVSNTFKKASCEVSGKDWNDTTKVCS